MNGNNSSFGLDINRIFMFVIFAACFLAASAMPVFAVHTSTPNLQPEWSSAGENMDYAVEIFNSAGSDPIDEVRIFRALDYSDFDCEPKTGWQLIENLTWYDADLGGLTKMCWYYTLDSNNNIQGNSSTVFEFSATVPDEGCDHKWKFETRDEESSSSGDWQIIFDYTSVDNLEPMIIKTLSGSVVEKDGETWITQDTELRIEAYDQGDVCGLSGLYSCEYRYDVDGVEMLPWTNIQWHNVQIGNPPHYFFKFKYTEDSEHFLEIRCYDKAGNMAYHSQTERVDDTPPETTKVYGTPSYPDDINTGGAYPHWITTKTPVTLSAVDPDPTKEDCNIGVDTIYYRDFWLPDNDKVCYDIDGMCNPEYYYQFVCKDEPWIPYTEPFYKEEESCHVIEFFSVDELGNEETINYQCVFVEDQAPTGYKDVGDPNIPCDDGDGYCDGTPEEDACEYYDETQCYDIDGCRWAEDVFCTGMPDADACETYPDELCLEINGCDWVEPTDPYCGGTPETESCSVYTSEQCSAISGCDWYVDGVDVCVGSPSIDACTVYTQNQCAIFESFLGCVWDSSVGCTGTPQGTCQYIQDIGVQFGYPDKCTETPGCEWDLGTGDEYCTGEPDSCQAAADGWPTDPQGKCEETIGCDWRVDLTNPHCEGTPSDTCYELENQWQGKCDETSGCYWESEESCEGTPSSCAVISDPYKCNDETEGCDWVLFGEYDCWWVQDHVTEIELDCIDEGPHPVDHETMCYRISYDLTPWLTRQYCEEFGGEYLYEVETGDGWCCVESMDLPYTFNFTEDSVHDLEYYCIDALGNENDVDLEYFKVDSVPPTITKTMIGTDHLGYRDGELNEDACPPKSADDTCYVRDDGVNGVRIDVKDGGEICAVDNVMCIYELWWEGNIIDSGKFGEEGIDIIFTEVVNCVDALGNVMEEDVEVFLVDSTPPETTKTYGYPFFEDWYPKGCYENNNCRGDVCPDSIYCGWAHWINSSTPITLTAKDEKVGVNITMWRNLLVDNNEICGFPEMFCNPEHYSQHIIDATDWNLYIDPFYKPEESCHVIEYYSVDLLGNEERTKWQCVFVDNTPPEVDKTIGEPKVIKGYGDGSQINGGQVVLDFEDLSGQASLPKDYAGLNWVTDWEYYDWAQTNYDPYSGVVRIYDNNNMQPTVTFPEPVTFEGAWFNGPSSTQSLQLLGYMDNVLVGSSATLAMTPTPTWLAADFGGPINKLVLDLKNGLNFFVMDDFTFTGGNLTVYITNETPITLTCQDLGEHPVDHVNMEYRYRISDDCETWEDWSDWFNPEGDDMNPDPYILEKTIYFPEDSCHELEYYCVDGLGNMGPIYTEIDIVDTQPPVIEKTIVGPQYYNATENRTYIDGVTEIHVNVTDPEPHPVGDVLCDWDYDVIDGKKIGQGQQNVTPPFVINFPEESQHILWIHCWDALGNDVEDVQTYYVDKTPPETTKIYEGPFEIFNGTKWITSDTEVILTAEDKGPHLSGVNRTYFKDVYLQDEVDWHYCYNNCTKWNDDARFGLPTAPEPYNPKGYVFTGLEESCHILEYYSVDNVNKTEEITWQCVFVDNSEPDPLKTVGEPREVWDGVDSYFYPEIGDLCWNGDNETEIECWKVTKDTEITMDCVDPEPHPVDHEIVCFNVEEDGDDVTEAYCEIYGEYNATSGFCCAKDIIEKFYFLERTEHELEYYCVDALGNKGGLDIEKFKVIGDAITIELNKKWNLISVPFVLLDDNVETVFEEIEEEVESVWTYDAETDQWFVYRPGANGTNNLEEITPGWGYWVMAYNDSELVIGGDLYNPTITPPSRELVEGYNLIGLYGVDEEIQDYTGPNGNGDVAYCALYTLRNEESIYPPTKWSALVTYWEDPMEFGQSSEWFEYGICDDTDLGAGYWIFMDEDKQYAKQTVCPDMLVSMLCWGSVV